MTVSVSDLLLALVLCETWLELNGSLDDLSNRNNSCSIRLRSSSSNFPPEFLAKLSFLGSTSALVTTLVLSTTADRVEQAAEDVARSSWFGSSTMVAESQIIDQIYCIITYLVTSVFHISFHPTAKKTNKPESRYSSIKITNV